MNYETEAPKGFIIAGQGDGVVEEWLGPFEDLGKIDHVIQDANHYGVEIPWRSCTRPTRTFRKLTSSGDYIESALDLIKDHPAVELDWESYGEDDDMPGRCGSFLMVLVRKNRAKSFLNQINNLRDSLLDFWESSGGWDREIDERNKRKEQRLRQEQAEKEAQRQRAIKVEREDKEAVESLVAKLSHEIREFQASSDEPFLDPDGTKRVLVVKNGPVYILEQDPYDSEKNWDEARLLTDRLEQIGFAVQRLKQYQPEGIGYIMAMNIAGRNKYRGWLQQNGVLTCDDPEIAEEATKYRTLFLEWRARNETDQ